MVKITFRLWILITFLALAVLMISPTLEKGIVIKSVNQDSFAFENGLRPGMKIEEINSKKIETIQQYSEIASGLLEKENESRIEIFTDKGTFIFLDRNLSSITVSEISRTKIKTGLDLSGGARALVKPKGETLSESEINDLVAITSQRLNTFGLTDLTVRSVKDLDGNNYMLIEIAGATTEDIEEIVGKQGKFEAKIANQTVFEGGEKDISDVCRNDASCASVTGCFESSGGQACNFAFTVYLREEAAQRHADITSNISLDESGQYLNESLILFIDDLEADSLLVASSLRGQTTTVISIQGSGLGTTQKEALEDAKKNMNKLQTILLTGSIPYEVEIVKLDTISPSLGKAFTKSMILLAVIVFLIVSLIIFIKYRKIKITLAVILTMFSEVFITLGIAALLKWNLDAAGIAGIIAGIGTGVNDQIVIIDESKSDIRTSVKERIKRALFIITGAFFTIVAAMLPLFWAGAGMLRGFAFTTIIGITVGILITRPAFAEIIKKMEER
ncbi:MMPL family transporter [Candidatus Pacearchaeota archaeon]|nr:MMPL family transporter [Candidatus Pacearchaeota archaeon]